MKRSLLIFTIILTTMISIGQSRKIYRPDFTTIQKEITDKNSPFYYPELFERFTQNDTTLDHDDYRHLYYGYTFQESYSPYQVSSYHDTLSYLMEIEIPDSGDFAYTAGILEKGLTELPFNLRFMNMLSYMYEALGEIDKAREMNIKMNKVIDIILMSGDGLSPETAYYVIRVPHEYDILNILGFTYGGQQSLMENNCDYLELEGSPMGIEGLYFNVDVLFQNRE